MYLTRVQGWGKLFVHVFLQRYIRHMQQFEDYPFWWWFSRSSIDPLYGGIFRVIKATVCRKPFTLYTPLAQTFFHSPSFLTLCLESVILPGRGWKLWSVFPLSLLGCVFLFFPQRRKSTAMLLYSWMQLPLGHVTHILGLADEGGLPANGPV